MRAAIVLVGACLVLLGCSGPPDEIIYVVAPHRDAAVIARDFRDGVAATGLEPDASILEQPGGSRTFVLQAWSPTIRVWAQAVPLSGYEDHPLCVASRGQRVDPRQFVIHLTLQLPLSRELRKVSSTLRRELTARGYQLSAAPLPCGAAADGAPAPTA